MVVSCKFSSCSDPGAIADYYMRETQPEHERDIDHAYEWRLVPDNQPGTLPELRPNLSREVALRMGISDVSVSRETLTRQQVLNLAAGRRADGGPSGRRFMNGGKIDLEGFSSRRDKAPNRTRHFVDITTSFDKSWALLLETAETAALRALVQEMLKGANSHVMHQFNDERGYTRRGKEDRLEKGELIWVSFPHYTTRPTGDGRVYPFFHVHNVVASNVVTRSGHVGAMHMAPINRKYIFQKTGELQNAISAGARRLGIDVRRDNRTGLVMAACIPEAIRQAMSQRGADMRRYVRQWCEARGLNWDAMGAHQRRPVMEQARRKTQGGYTDGMATRGEWRADMARLGWRGGDVGRPWDAALVPRLARPGPAPTSLADRARALRDDVRGTWRLAKHAAERADLGQRFTASPALAATLARALAPTLARQAVRVREAIQRLQQNPETPWQARRAGGLIQASGTNAAVQSLAVTLAPALKQLQMKVEPKQMDMPAARQGPDMIERLVRIYARKVFAGETSMSSAVDYFVRMEEYAVKPTGYNPVHQTYSYPAGSPGPQNRYQREDKWTDRIGDAIEKLHNGTLWDDVIKPRQDEPAGPRMRMER